ncbi:MAG: hypothetical protein EOO14_01655 [Chitinophagaceae bacterium]|nr:MAG: hypothetical protein EOO14_01655 [Chitinophagaceae bacterium]
MAISEKLPSTTFLSREGFAGSLLPTGSNDGYGLFRVKSQKPVSFDVRRTCVLSSVTLNAIITARERPSVWRYIFYQAILFPEHYFW